MSVEIHIAPSSSTLDMYGEPSELAAYSLSGNVIIALAPLPSFFDCKREVRILLQSLTITFEGQTELVTEDTGYAALRLCSISKELVPGEPIELNNDGSVDSSRRLAWSVVFNLTVPGWLPPSAPFGDHGGGTKYGLYAQATFEYIDGDPQRSWLSTFCSPFRFAAKAVKASAPIEVHRYISPSMVASTSTSVFPTANFAVAAHTDKVDERSPFPPDILSRILVQCTVPECVSMEEDALPFTLRLRTSGLSREECAKLRATGFSVEIDQVEKYRPAPHREYLSQYPVPKANEQPPHKKLRSPHPIHSLYELGIALKDTNVLTRKVSIVSEEASGAYSVAGDGYIFQRDPDENEETTWFVLPSRIGLRTPPAEVPEDWRADMSRKPSLFSPFLNVSHRMSINLMCTYDTDLGELEPRRVTAQLRFHIPLRFVRTPPPRPAVQVVTTPSCGGIQSLRSLSTLSTSSLVDLRLPTPYAASQSLPAYSQLFHTNGDRKIDYSIPLPLYTAQPTESDMTVLLGTPEYDEDEACS